VTKEELEKGKHKIDTRGKIYSKSG